MKGTHQMQVQVFDVAGNLKADCSLEHAMKNYCERKPVLDGFSYRALNGFVIKMPNGFKITKLGHEANGPMPVSQCG
jgi:hypothetical protein